jgi:hypothetical protein
MSQGPQNGKRPGLIQEKMRTLCAETPKKKQCACAPKGQTDKESICLGMIDPRRDGLERRTSIARRRVHLEQVDLFGMALFDENGASFTENHITD